MFYFISRQDDVTKLICVRFRASAVKLMQNALRDNLGVPKRR